MWWLANIGKKLLIIQERKGKERKEKRNR